MEAKPFCRMANIALAKNTQNISQIWDNYHPPVAENVQNDMKLLLITQSYGYFNFQ